MTTNKKATGKKQQTAKKQAQRKKQLLFGGIGAAVLCVGLLIVLLLSGGTATDSTFTSGSNDEGNTASDTQAYEPVEELDASLTYYADIEIQDYGTITFKLDQASAPITCTNFVNLAQSGFYDGLTFHRIIYGFMMQGGDPNGNGTGGSDHTIVGEFPNNLHFNNLSHTKGAVSMARSSAYDSASSQFFIVHEDSTFLDGDYAVFGYVTEGQDIVDAICSSAKPIDGNGTIPAQAQPVMTSVTIRTES